MTIKGNRGFFRDDFPLLMGRQPDHPAPAHVANGFLHEAFGEGSLAGTIRSLLRGEDPEIDLSSINVTLRTPGKDHARFRDCLNVALNLDRRVFPKGPGSPFPLTASVITRDPTDQGFGKELFRLVCSYYDEGVMESLATLLRPDPQASGIEVLAALLSDDDVAERSRYLSDAAWPPAEAGSKLASHLAAAVADLIVETINLDSSIPRIQRLATFSAAAHLGAFLLALRTPELVLKKASSWTQVKPAFVYAGTPPGESGERAARLASSSFEVLVDAHRGALQSYLAQRLEREARRLPKNLPNAQRKRSLLERAFPNLKPTTLEEAIQLIGRINDLDKIAHLLLEAIYPDSHLESGFRRLGRKIGLAGPDRGYGSPRLLLETPTLALLVVATVDEGPIPYEDWIDILFDRFGLILGLGTAHDFTEPLLGLGAPRGLVHDALRDNTEELRRRLVRSGLALEFSDGETEVHNPLAAGVSQ